MNRLTGQYQGLLTALAIYSQGMPRPIHVAVSPGSRNSSLLEEAISVQYSLLFDGSTQSLSFVNSSLFCTRRAKL